MRIDFRDEMVKKRQFVEDKNGYTRGFVFVEINNGVISIGHKFGGVIRTLTTIEYADLDMAIKYFDRI